MLKLTHTVTIQKLDMDRAEKRALFDADWVPQVTYELITSKSPWRCVCKKLRNTPLTRKQNLRDLVAGARSRKLPTQRLVRSR